MTLAALILMFNTATDKFDLPKGLLSAICYIESKHDPEAVNQDDGDSESLGICQIKEETARSIGFKGTKEQLMRPRTNVYYAAKYLKQQLNRYDNNAMKAVAAYNAGSYKPSRRHEGAVNRGYVKKVFVAWANSR